MHSQRLKKMITTVLVICILNLGLPVSAYAGLIGTDQVMASQERDTTISRISNALQRENVRHAMTSLGVDAADISDRLAGLTTSELQQIDQELENLPAGGNILIIIGAVFVVLLILELVGVTDVFSKI